jgi:hypothetical protein
MRICQKMAAFQESIAGKYPVRARATNRGWRHDSGIVANAEQQRTRMSPEG